ncbi:MAG: chaperonin GroEL [Paracoccaceae bacterium]|nr:chaperonin GroEL [Paracoccaceae bacterium]
MSASRIVFGGRARDRLLRGVDIAGRAIGVTFGPRGRNVLLDRHYGGRISKDGVAVARMMEFDDPFINIGAALLRDATVRVSDDVGDGTTTAAVLCHAMVRDGVRAVAAGLNPMDLRRGIDIAVSKATAALARHTRKIGTPGEIESVACIAANGDAEIARIVAEALDSAGSEGAITVEAGQGMESTLTVAQGFEFKPGYLSHHFITDKKTATCELEDPLILVSQDTLSEFQPLLPLFDEVYESGCPLLVIAQGIEGETLNMLIVNTENGALQAAAVKGPAFGDRQKALLGDIATVTGATVLAEALGIAPANAGMEHLGTARRVSLTAGKTCIVDGAGHSAEIGDRCAAIRGQARQTDSHDDREWLSERLARLAGGVAVIRVGGGSEDEVKERRDRFDNALRSSRATMAEGYLPGGGTALLRAARDLDGIDPANLDQKAGIDIVRRALREPVRRIAENAGYEGSTIAARLSDRLDGKTGFDATNGREVDMVEAGIIDATMVVRTALQTAASLASLAITTEALVFRGPLQAPTSPMDEEHRFMSDSF